MNKKTIEERVRDQWDCYNNGAFGHLQGAIEFIQELVDEATKLHEAQVRREWVKE